MSVLMSIFMSNFMSHFSGYKYLTFLFIAFTIATYMIAPNLIPGQSSRAQAAIFNAQEGYLDNGMQVVFIPNHRAPIAAHMVWVKVGSVDEPPGEGGLAHFLEHLMFKGTSNTAPGEFSRRVKLFGAQHNAFTSRDYTAYFETVSVDHLDEIMRLEADRLQNLAPPLKDVESEQQVVVEERRQRVDNNPEAQLQEHLTAAFYQTHPYARPVIGWKQEVEALTWDHALAFYKKWYAPNNMILVMTGDLTFQQAMDLAQKHYGRISSRTTPKTQPPFLPYLNSDITVSHKSKDVSQAQISLLYAAPSFSQNKRASLALQILTEILAGNPSSYLNQRLINQDKIATDLTMAYYDMARYDSSIDITIIPRDDTGLDLPAIKNMVISALADLTINGIDDAAFNRAKSSLIAQSIYARDSLIGPAMIIGRSLASGAQLQDIEQWDKDIHSVTKDEVLSALRSYLITPERHPVAAYLSPDISDIDDQGAGTGSHKTTKNPQSNFNN